MPITTLAEGGTENNLKDAGPGIVFMPAVGAPMEILAVNAPGNAFGCTLVVATPETSTAVGPAGGADALPESPAGYLTIRLPNGSPAMIAYYPLADMTP